MSVELSKAIVLAATNVQEAQTTQIIPQPITDPPPCEDTKSISSSEYRKCKRRIQRLELAVDELRRVLCKYTGASTPMESVDSP